MPQHRHCLALSSAALALLFAPCAQAAKIISPFADDLAPSAYSADAAYAGTSAMAAFNGGVWNAGSWGTHWIQADMGSFQTLSQVVLTIAISPNFQAWQKVFISGSPIGNAWAQLQPVATHSGFAQHGDVYTLSFTPTSGRYLQIVANAGERAVGGSWTALGDYQPRVNWMDTPPAAPVPEPGRWAMLVAGLGLLPWLARRRPARAA